jgi:predicted CoA-binding protein
VAGEQAQPALIPDSETDMSQTVVVLGASPKPDRYSNRAVRMLREYGHRVIPIHPKAEAIEGIPAVPALGAVQDAVDTLTVYVGPDKGEAQADGMIRLRPGRVILNPGTESDALQTRLDAAGIPWEHACTLVLLQTGQFEKTS